MILLSTYISSGIYYLINLIPLAFIIFNIYLGLTFLIKRNLKLNLMLALCQFTWILIVLTILFITGILGGHFDFSLLTNGCVLYSLKLFEEGVTTATLLNLVLFIPYGFLSTIMFKKVRERWIYAVLVGLIFTVTIECLQIFIGRFVQLEDILMNILGTYIGYLLCMQVLRLKTKFYLL